MLGQCGRFVAVGRGKGWTARPGVVPQPMMDAGRWNNSIGGSLIGHKAEFVERTSDCYSTGVGKRVTSFQRKHRRGGRDMLRPGQC
jgi:hypothetical protein